MSPSRRGNKVRSGEYTITVDDDNFTHFRYKGDRPARRKVTKQELVDKGVTIDEVLGEESSWENAEDRQSTWNEIDTIAVDNITIRPNKIVSFLVEGIDGISQIDVPIDSPIVEILFPGFNK
jgi:hypothetical protein